MSAQPSRCAIFMFKNKHISIFHSLEVVDRDSKTQLQASENLNHIIWHFRG